MEINCCICYLRLSKTSNYQSNKTICNFVTNLTKFLNSTNSNSLGAVEYQSSDLNKSSQNMFCCDQCSSDIQIFCDMWDSRDLLLADIIGLVVTISNLIKSKQNKICQVTINCLICQSAWKKKTKASIKHSQIEKRCKRFKLLLKRFLSNTKKLLFDKEMLKEIVKGYDYCCDMCHPTMETFCEIYEAIDNVQLELFRLLDKILNSLVTKSDVKSLRNIPVFWQDFAFKVEGGRKLHYPRVTLEALKLEPAPTKSEAQSSLASATNHCFNHSTDIMPTDVKSEKITMEYEPDMNMSTFKSEREPISNDEVGKQVKQKVRISRSGQQKKYQCLFCPSKFLYPGRLEMHIKIHTGENTYNCRICLEEFKSREGFINHWRRNHRAASAEATRTRQFQCLLCDHRCSTRRYLVKHHQSVHSDERPFSCKICEASFKHKATLYNHHRSVHEGQKKRRKEKCPACSESFASRDSLRHHCEALHSKESVACVCKLCGKSFFPMSRLKAHVWNVHEGGNTQYRYKFKCRVCGQRGFPTASEMKQHLQRLHPDDSIYKCSYNGCEATFYFNSALKSHMLKHSEERTFQCEHCQDSFKMKYSLSRHIQKFHKTFKCEHSGCDMVFTEKFKLETHKLTRHIDEKKFQCQYCKRSFAFEYSLNMHMLVHPKM